MEDKSLLVRLAEACQWHRATHHKDRQDHEVQSEACQRDLEVLSCLVPKVEAEYLNSKEVDNLCDFYTDVLDGGFCPHAPEIFRGNVDDLLKRSIGLMEQLGSRRVLKVTLKSEVLVDKLCHTVSRLLVSATGLERSLGIDLANFCMDLSIVREAKLVETNETVRVTLFAETCGTPDYFLDIPTVEALLALQLAAIKLVCSFNSQLRKSRLQSVEDASKVYTERNPDAIWRNETIPLASLRQVLLTSLPQSSKAQVLSMKAKSCALELLNSVLSEWHQFGFPDYHREIVLLVSRTVLWWFSSYPHDSVSSRTCTATLLSASMQDAILLAPPLNESYNKNHLLSLPWLLDCVVDLPLALEEESHLCFSLLSTIEFIISEGSVLLEHAAHHCATHDIYPTLFRMLGVSSSTSTRCTVVKILQALLRSNNLPKVTLSFACQCALLSVQPQEQDLPQISVPEKPITTPPRPAPSGSKRKRVSLPDRSPLQLVFEASPKRTRVTEVSHVTPCAGTSTKLSQPDRLLSPSSFSDSLKNFLTKTLKIAHRIAGLCRQTPCALDPVGDDTLHTQLSECGNAMLLLLTLTMENTDQWIEQVRAAHYEAFSEVAVVLRTAWLYLHSTASDALEKLSRLTEELINVGLTYYLTLPPSRFAKEHTINRFLENLSICAWDAMTQFTNLEEESLEWIGCCGQCTFMMRFLNVKDSSSRACNCSMRSGAFSGSQINVIGWPMYVKVAAFAFANPSPQKSSLTNRNAAEALVVCKSSVQKSQAIIMSLPSKNHIFDVLFLGMLPFLVLSWTREMFLLTENDAGSQQEKSRMLDEVYHIACSTFPHELFLNILKEKKSVVTLQKGALIGLHHFRSVLRSTSWKDRENVEINFAHLNSYFSRAGPSYENDAEPHHSLSSIDRDLRLAVLSMSFEESQLSDTDRVFRWRVVKDVVLQTPPSEIHSISNLHRGLPSEGNNLPVVFRWLLSAPFADTSYKARLTLSREFGDLFWGKHGHTIQAVFGNSSHGNDMEVDSGNAIVTSLLNEIDRLVVDYSHMPRSQMPSTFANSTMSETNQEVDPLAVQFQHTALRAIASLCQFAEYDDGIGRVLTEHAILRLVRIWATFDDSTNISETEFLKTSISALSFSELRRLGGACDFSFLSSVTSQHGLLPSLISEVLEPATSSLIVDSARKALGWDIRQRQNILLYLFLELFVLPFPFQLDERNRESVNCDPGLNLLRSSHDPSLVADFVDECLLFAIPIMVADKDYDAILLSTGFKLFVLGLHSAISSSGTDDSLIGSSIHTALSKAAGMTVGRSDLEEQSRNLCLKPEMLERILSRLLIGNYTDRSQVVFFLEVALQNKTTLQKLVAKSDKTVLKGLIWELGGRAHASQSAVQAVKMAALLVSRERGSREGHDSETDTTQIACTWVSFHFMFLFVNIVQHKWHQKTLEDRIKSLRSLDLMLKFLLPSEAPQFLMQMVATVSTATSQDYIIGSRPAESARIWQLRSLAAQNLFDYCESLLQGSIETIGRNLATIVVALFPVLVQSEDSSAEDLETRILQSRAGELAAGILEKFTTDQVGKELAPYFQNVPFLPMTPLLSKTRENLKDNGVDLDELTVLSNVETTQRVLSGKENMTGDGTNEREDGIPRDELIFALQTRLRVIRPLLSHESANVRLVALQHLTDLLRANRILLYRLIEMESSMITTLTVQYPDVPNHESTGSVTSLVEALLSRASLETVGKVKIAVGICLGEVAAIDRHRLGTISTATVGEYTKQSSMLTIDGRSWQLSNPPWQSSIRAYSLHLLTNQLANALKSASSSAEQHKVAHTIQQLLLIVDKISKDPISSSNAGVLTDASTLESNLTHSQSSKGPISEWLSEELDRAGVLDVLEPYWASSFSETGTGTLKEPPFFRTAENYCIWISRWCRYMIVTSYDNGSCPWRRFLYACRTAVRSVAGVVVSELILPLLIMERLCFGSRHDEEIILQELHDVFEITGSAFGEGNNATIVMSFNECQKVVNSAFNLVDTLKLWSERETEGCFKRTAKGEVQSMQRSDFSGSDWSSTLCLERIADLAEGLSLKSMSKSATAMGMHARALVCLECEARAKLAGPIYDTTKAEDNSNESTGSRVNSRQGLGSRLLDGVDISLLKKVLGKLDDYPTMRAVTGRNICLLYDEDSIRDREARGDWTGALNDYERALRSQNNVAIRSYLEHGSLRCLLELGQYESVLNQVNGIIYKGKASKDKLNVNGVEQAIPLAIEAAWRLGRWSVLESLVDECDLKPRVIPSAGDYRLAIGKAMLGIHRRSLIEVNESLCIAREAVMAKLSSVARDSYERAYPRLVELHCIREIEDASILLHETAPRTSQFSEMAKSVDICGWAWDLRLDIASNVDSSGISDVRLALARLAGDTRLEGELLFMMGKKARKNLLIDVASTYFAQASSIFASLSPKSNEDSLIKLIGNLQMQLAKLRYQAGESGSALRILGVEEIQAWSKLDRKDLLSEVATKLQIITGRTSLGSDQSVLQDMAKRLLKSTRWIAEGGLKAVPDIMERFRVTNQLRPKWEKSHFEFGKYVDSILEARIFGVAQHEGWSSDDDTVRHYALSEDMNCQNYLLMAMEQYLEALKVSDKHVYQALPRLLSLWFEYASVDRSGSRRSSSRARGRDDTSPLKVSSDPNVFLERKQEEANQLFARAATSIPSAMFYTATPQLISRLCHPNLESARLVQNLLTRVLSKFPGQAMWELAWVRNSLDKRRASLGNAIFHSAQKSILGWELRAIPRNKTIFEKNRQILAASKSFVTYLIDVAKYTPKDDRSRTFRLCKWRGEVELCDFIPPVQSTLSSPFDSSRQGRDPFPRFRAVHESVQIMSSKAKPKRVRFYVVPGGSLHLIETHGVAKGRSSADVGELHFLLKNEVKGDLRKDARVQDLNNVINRLLAAAGKGKRQRRLQLRTFAVTCLSEDCGSVEWVPKTDSFRSLASRSYNPQAATYSAKRRGKRIANFGDPSLKKNFETCQNFFFKNGDLSRAAKMFETHFLNSFPPLFYWWFVQTFMDPHAWYEARTNFTTTVAVWSAVGHVIGLGDRHSENLLVDTSTGGCVHVDFDCIFDKGLTLPKPEIIPFRLTPNMIDAFGPVGADGMFSESLKTAMSVLRDNRDTLLSVLEPFLKDPIIDWKKSKGSQRNESDTGIRDTKQARRSMKVIDERLRGIYNLRNPNFKKIKRTDQVAIDHDEEMAQMIPLSVEGQVHKMISEATSHENLIQLYIGWMPWI